MPEYVFVSIPETLYRRAHDLARVRHQSTDVIITEALEQLLAAQSALGFVAPSTADETAMAREMAAYEAMHADLMSTFAGQYVVLHGGQLVDHDADETALLRRVAAPFGGKVVLLKRVAPLPEPELRIRSPRLERNWS